MRAAERALHETFGPDADYFSGLRDRMLSRAANDEELLVALLDFTVHTMGAMRSRGYRYETELAVLDALLEQGGSVWTVAIYPDKSSLERRVDETVTTAARDVMSRAGRAGEHLATAWNKAYGRQSSSSEAYREAVRAVEVASIPVVAPKDPAATLGKVIRSMKDAPHKWTVVLNPKQGNAVDHVREMCELLWTAQLDRHGTADESVPLNVSPEEAEAAVHLATTLVHYFASGVVRRAG